jgi:hypothetical protein
MLAAFRTYVSECGLDLTELSTEEKLQWRKAFDASRGSFNTQQLGVLVPGADETKSSSQPPSTPAAKAASGAVTRGSHSLSTCLTFHLSHASSAGVSDDACIVIAELLC